MQCEFKPHFAVAGLKFHVMHVRGAANGKLVHLVMKFQALTRRDGGILDGRTLAGTVAAHADDLDGFLRVIQQLHGATGLFPLGKPQVAVMNHFLAQRYDESIGHILALGPLPPKNQPQCRQHDQDNHRRFYFVAEQPILLFEPTQGLGVQDNGKERQQCQAAKGAKPLSCPFAKSGAWRNFRERERERVTY